MDTNEVFGPAAENHRNLISTSEAQIKPRQPIPWDLLFLRIAALIAGRSKDPSTQVGAVLVNQDNVVLAEGFNGPPREIDDLQVPWGVRPAKYAWVIHAEENCILTALDGYGRPRLQGSRMFCTHATCSRCVMRCIRAGVKEILIPSNAPDYPMSEWDCVHPAELVEAQKFPKLILTRTMWSL